ncbi:hypothetical protein [Nocardia sp. MW-W600-9]
MIVEVIGSNAALTQLLIDWGGARSTAAFSDFRAEHRDRAAAGLDSPTAASSAMVVAVKTFCATDTTALKLIVPILSRAEGGV